MGELCADCLRPGSNSGNLLRSLLIPLSKSLMYIKISNFPKTYTCRAPLVTPTPQLFFPFFIFFILHLKQENVKKSYLSPDPVNRTVGKIEAGNGLRIINYNYLLPITCNTIMASYYYLFKFWLSSHFLLRSPRVVPMFFRPDL